MEIDREWSKEKTIETSIWQIRELEDKKQRKFLVLRISSSDSSILVFSNNVKEELWGDLLAGQKYNLVIKENERGNWKLVDFSPIWSFS